MGLASALTTALTGLTAAETQIDVVGNNLANSQTIGFKASEALFATQFLQTLGLGSGPTANTGGTNPRQTGLGTQVAEISPDFTQGTIEISTNPSDLAIQGDGFFMVQGASGETLYTRNGLFKTNSRNELVTITGNRLLGYGVNDSFQLQTTQITQLSIPLGAAAVAQATENVYLEGTLSPSGDVATTAEVIESAVLGDAAVPRPDILGDSDGDGVPDVPPVVVSVGAVPTVGASAVVTRPGLGAAFTSFGVGTLADSTVFDYRVTFGNVSGADDTLATDVLTATTPVTGDLNSVLLNDIPTDAAFNFINVYRSTAGGAYSQITSVAMPGGATATITDNGFPDSGTALDPTLTIAPPTHVAGTSFNYRFTFVDNNTADPGGVATETLASDPVSVTVGANNSAIRFTGLATSTEYANINVYRTVDGGSDYYFLKQVAMSSTIVDDDSMPLTGTAMEAQDGITGNYSYLVTFHKAGEEESRPSLTIGPRNVSDGRIHLTELPQPIPGGTPDYDQVRVYRNLASDASTFYLVTTLQPGEDYTDARSDTAISDLTVSGNKVIDMDGPKIASNTLLTNVIRRDSLNFESQFTTGELRFSGRKGGRSLGTKEFTVAADSTVQDLIDFMDEAMGIRVGADDPQNPIPTSLNTIPGETGVLAPGGTIQGGKIRFVSNNGVDNALSVELAAFQLDPGDGTVLNPSLSFGTVQDAVGETAVTDFIVFDTLGIPITVRMTAALETRTGSTTTYRWYADSPDNDPVAGSDISVGTGLISFDGEGNLINTTNTTVSIDRRNIPSTSPLEFDFDFSQVSGLSAENSSVAATRQDGFATGKLTSFIIGEDGTIRGVFTNGASRDLGQVRLARFGNNAGLEQRGQNLFAAGVNSGLPIQGGPGEEGIGKIIAGARELSNTDIGRNLIDLVLATTQYRGNTRVITAAQQLLDELLNLRR